jgi:hypothetical protein
MEILKVYEYEDTLYSYKKFVVASSKEKADKIVKEDELTFVKVYDIVEGLSFEGGGNG